MQVPSSDDKIQALRAYNRARSLCYTCGEQWAHDHNCGPTVQLIVEELLGLLDCERETYSSQSAQSADLCAIFDVALQGVEPPLTICLWGVVQQQKVLMLVDASGDDV
jgi:hypothetical protein